jgi:hypothetical protein
MQMLNRYFAPFALLLILSAIYFSEPEPAAYKASLAILATSFAVNWLVAKYTYRYVNWVARFKELQVWLDFLWAVPLFWLLQPFWGPMWLLFVMAPATAALTGGRWHTIFVAVVSAGTMLGIYWVRGVFDLGPNAAGQVVVHAAFILVFSLFIHGLAQAALRLRDANLA